MTLAGPASFLPDRLDDDSTKKKKKLPTIDSENPLRAEIERQELDDEGERINGQELDDDILFASAEGNGDPFRG